MDFFGEHKVGRVDIDFLTEPTVTAPYTEGSLTGVAEKHEFARSRRVLVRALTAAKD